MKKILIPLVLLTSFVIAQAGTINVKGSDTMVILGQRLAEQYMKLNKGTTIAVSGGGSGVGISALINKTTDICQASRDMKPKETQDATANGVKPYRAAIALDGIAVFVNTGNPVKTFTLAQLKGIYTGKITNWKEVGGPDKPIILYGRENSSGTYAFFKEHVMTNEDYAATMQAMAGTAALVNAVSKDANGIGYSGVAWDKGVHVVSIKKDEKSAAIAPIMETITNGTYPITRALYWFTNGTPTGEMKSLLNWVISADGQEIVKAAEYIPLPKDMALEELIP